MPCLIKSIVILPLSLLVFGCSKETYNLNEEITLKYNKSAIVNVDGERFKIKFTKLEEDSRCPPGASCFWAGQVAVKMKINDEADFLIGHHTTIPSQATYKNRTINLLDVTYDADSSFGEEKRCSIKIQLN